MIATVRSRRHIRLGTKQEHHQQDKSSRYALCIHGGHRDPIGLLCTPGQHIVPSVRERANESLQKGGDVGGECFECEIMNMHKHGNIPVLPTPPWGGGWTPL